ncbi:MAG: hypothetical protein KJ593_06860 [Candidatus Omnitrophica bacterium]|nr:hypothetical protein [Candidatus Omnitrophota bacterium]
MNGKFRTLIFICILSIPLVSCANLQEAGKKFWGSSTEALERKRGQGEVAAFRCSFSGCFTECLEILESMEAEVFKKDSQIGQIIAINFEDAIDTTEVGLFFKAEKPNLTSVEIICLNSHLQDAASSYIFSKLNEKFKVAK